MMRSELSALPSTSDLMAVFPEWILANCGPGAEVLEVGAGEGKYGYPARVRERVGRLVGVDPDGAIERNPYLDERYQMSIERFAEQCDRQFDCLYMMFVLEHVSDPPGFLRACRKLLKPGGSLFAATPNLWHYFGLGVKLSASVGIEDWLLERLRGAQMKESYHFPTEYRMNSTRSLRSSFQAAGFREVEFRCFDEPSRFEVYLPGRLKSLARGYSRAVYALDLPQIMGILMVRARL